MARGSSPRRRNAAQHLVHRSIRPPGQFRGGRFVYEPLDVGLEVPPRRPRRRPREVAGGREVGAQGRAHTVLEAAGQPHDIGTALNQLQLDPRGREFDLSAIDANTEISGNQAFQFGGTTAGRVRVVNNGSNSEVLANTDGDAAAELRIVIEDGSVQAGSYTRDDILL